MTVTVFGIILFALALFPRDKDPHLPPLRDLDRFPGRAAATDGRVFSRDYLNHLDQRLLNEPHLKDGLERLAERAAWHHKCWDVLEDAHVWGDPRQKREKLAHLKLLLGRDAYAAGLMPLPVPVECFPEVGPGYRQPTPALMESAGP